MRMHVMRVLVLSLAWSSKHYTHTLHTPYTTSIEHTHTETKLNWLVTVRRGVLCTVWVCVLLMMLSSDCCMTWFVSAAAIYLHLLLVTVVSTISIVRSYGNGRCAGLQMNLVPFIYSWSQILWFFLLVPMTTENEYSILNNLSDRPLVY